MTARRAVDRLRVISVHGLACIRLLTVHLTVGLIVVLSVELLIVGLLHWLTVAPVLLPVRINVRVHSRTLIIQFFLSPVNENKRNDETDHMKEEA